MSKFEFIGIFPTGIASAEINDIKYIDILKDTILKDYNTDKRNERSTPLSNSQKDDTEWVTRGYPWQSNALQHKREVFGKLIDFTNETAASYMDSIGYHYDELYMTQCWSNVYEKTKSIHPHRHFNSFLSWNFIISGQDAPFVLQQNSFGSIQPSLKFNIPENSQQIAISPKSGILVIFPSYLMHYTSPNRSDDYRITISGNVMLSGQVGSYEELNWDGMWSIEDAIGRLENGWYFNVLEMNDYIIGWVWLNTIENELCNLYVNREIRKQGYGKQLIYSIMNLAKDDNIDTIYAEVDWWNDSSHITFLRCGWKEYEKD